jgi:TPR repeat protein
MYANGQGVPQDDTQAAAWYRKAADQGNATAQTNFGIMYAKGQGVPRDDAQAAAWYQKAADQGNAKAQVILGLMYELGQGVPQDYLLAYMWSDLSAALAKDAELRQLGVQGRDEVAAKMTPDQIAEAQRMARERKPK